MKSLLNIFTLYELLTKSSSSSAKYNREDIILKKVQVIVNYAYEHVPFYKEKYDNCNFHPKELKQFSDLKKIPPISKEELRDYMRVNPFENSKQLFVEATSGSTGVSFTLYRTSREKAYLNAKFIHALFKLGYKPFYNTFSISTPAQLRKRDSILQLIGILKRSSVSLEEKIEVIAHAFLKSKAELLYGYKTQLINLGQYLHVQNISFKNPKMVVVAGEIVDKNALQLLKSYFGDSISVIYGSIELNNMAYRQHFSEKYTINNKCQYLELLPLEQDGYGEICITDYRLKTLPLIRYKTGDLATVTHQNSLRFIDEIYGKIENKVITSYETIYDFTFIKIMDTIEGIERFKIIQTDKNSFDIMVQYAKSLDLTIKVYQAMSDKFGNKYTFTIKPVPFIQADKNGKLRLVQPLQQP